MAQRVFRTTTLEKLTIRDERSFRRVPLYADLKDILRRDRYVFRILPAPRWDRALFLNLTYWDGAGGDILEKDAIAADVVMHVAWHHLAAKALPLVSGRAQSAEALFLGESIASAFDAYLVGRLLALSSTSTFLETQVPAMAEAARGAGLSARRFETLLARLAADPAQSFSDLRELLYTTSCALYAAGGADDALSTLTRAERHPLGALLHHYALSNWVLYARAYANLRPGRSGPLVGSDLRAVCIDDALRNAPSSLAWLRTHWILPAVAPARVPTPEGRAKTRK